MDFDRFTLVASTADLDEEPRARARADAIEFRMDLADDPLDALATYDGELPILATNRAEWEGGAVRRPAEASNGRLPRDGDATDGDGDRLDALAAATAVDAVGAIDVELAAIRNGDADELLETARERDVRIVVSAHDFEGTPPRPALVRTLTEAGAHGDVAKLAVTAESRADALAVLSATEQLTSRGERVATMAMGEVGRHTRAVAPVYGSRIGYAPVDPDAATAPGQYDVETLDRLVGRLLPKREN